MKLEIDECNVEIVFHDGYGINNKKKIIDGIMPDIAYFANYMKKYKRSGCYDLLFNYVGCVQAILTYDKYETNVFFGNPYSILMKRVAEFDKLEVADDKN